MYFCTHGTVQNHFIKAPPQHLPPSGFTPQYSNEMWLKISAEMVNLVSMTILAKNSVEFV